MWGGLREARLYTSAPTTGRLSTESNNILFPETFCLAGSQEQFDISSFLNSTLDDHGSDTSGLARISGTLSGEATNNRSFSNGTAGDNPSGSILAQANNVLINSAGFVSDLLQGTINAVLDDVISTTGILTPSIILDANNACQSICLINGTKTILAWDLETRSPVERSTIVSTNWEILSGSAVEILGQQIDPNNFYSTVGVLAVKLGTSVIKTTTSLSDGRVIVGILNIVVNEC